MRKKEIIILSVIFMLSCTIKVEDSSRSKDLETSQRFCDSLIGCVSYPGTWEKREANEFFIVGFLIDKDSSFNSNCNMNYIPIRNGIELTVKKVIEESKAQLSNNGLIIDVQESKWTTYGKLRCYRFLGVVEQKSSDLMLEQLMIKKDSGLILITLMCRSIYHDKLTYDLKDLVSSLNVESNHD